MLDRNFKAISVHVRNVKLQSGNGRERPTAASQVPGLPFGGPEIFERSNMLKLSLQASERIVGPWHHDAQQADYPSIASTSSASPHLVQDGDGDGDPDSFFDTRKVRRPG